MKRILIVFFAVLKFAISYAQLKTDTISFYDSKIERTYNETGNLLFSCEYDSADLHLRREIIYFSDVKVKSERFFDEWGLAYLKQFNISLNHYEYFEYSQDGTIFRQYEDVSDSIDGKYISYYSSGVKEEEGYKGNVDEYEAAIEDSVSLGGLKFLFHGHVTNVGLWKYYYENGQLEEEGNYARFGTIGSDTEVVNSNDSSIMTVLVVESAGIKDGTWNYYSPEGKLIYTEEWNKGNLLKRRTF